MKLFTRLDNSFIGRWWWTVDRGMLMALITLMVCGVMLVSTASPSVAETIGVGHHHFLKRHIVWLGVALTLMIGCSFLSRRAVWRVASVVFAGSILAMVAVLFSGMEIKGAQRWIHLGGFSLQPSEFVKPAFIIVAAWLLARPHAENKFPGLVIASGLYFLVISLLLLQPDFGMTFVVTAVAASMIFLAGAPFRWLVVLAGAGIGGGVMAYFTLSHVQSRIDRFLDPASGDSYQVQKSLEAFQNGGFFGAGPGMGTVKEKLPDAHADFIFAVAGEEFGLALALALLALYAYILLRGYNRLMDNEDIFAILASGGILSMFGLQAMIHMGSALHLLPAKGMTLPFISYGGSSMMAMGMAMGMVLALTRGRQRSGIARSSIAMRGRAA